jgi:hypothetical protein
MAKLIECDYCGEQIPEADYVKLSWTSESENLTDFCCSECQDCWHDENDPESDNNEVEE